MPDDSKAHCMQDKNDSEKTRIKPKDLLRYVNSWLQRNFASILGESAILPKAAAILSAVLILYFNYLKHRFDIGYYHKVFGVPEEYLGLAWNSGMTDFVLNALIFLLRSMVLIGILGAVCAFVVLRLSKMDDSKKIRLFTFSAIAILSLGILYLIFSRFLPRLRQASAVLLWGAVALAGAVAMMDILILIWDFCQKEKTTEECKHENLSNNLVPPDQHIFTEGYIQYLRDHRTKDSVPTSAAPKVSSSNPKPVVLSAREKGFLIGILCLGLIVSGFLACLFGEKMASLETNMMYLVPDEALAEELHKLNDQREDPAFWAVVCRTGEHYIIMPCRINEKRAGEKDDEMTVYPKYHSVIPSEGVVLMNGTFARVLIDGNTMIDENGWTNPFQRFSSWLQDILNQTPEPTETEVAVETKEPPLPPETTAPPVPTETTEPIIPAETTEPIIPAETTEPTIPTEQAEDIYISIDPANLESILNFSFSDVDSTSDNTSGAFAVQNVVINIVYPVQSLHGCDDCRCTPGLG